MDTTSLYDRCLSGDREAMATLYMATYRRMISVVRRYVADDDRVRDIVHDGFIIVFISLGKLREPSKLESWMAGVMRRLALKSEINARRYDMVGIDGHEPVVSDCYDSPDPDLGWDELSGMIDRLPEGYRKVFRLSVLEGKSHKEIGKMLSIGAHSSSSQLSRAKVLLRRMVSDYRMNMLAMLLLAAAGAFWYVVDRYGMRGICDPEFMRTASVMENHTDPGVIADTVERDGDSRKESLAVARVGKNVSRRHVCLAEDVVTEVENNTGGGETDMTKAESEIPENVRDGESEERLPLIDDKFRDVTAPEYMAYSSSEGGAWSVSIDYEGLFPGRNGGEGSYMIGNGLTNEPVMEVNESLRHKMPFTVGVSVSRQLSPRWSVETGIRFSRLRSDSVADCMKWHREAVMKTTCIGIPLKVSYAFVRSHGLSVYGQAGICLDIPLRSEKTVMFSYPDKGISLSWKEGLGRRVQWSGEIGVGIQYELVPHVSIFAEPSLRYYFPGGLPDGTVWTDRRLIFTVPFGVRIRW